MKKYLAISIVVLVLTNVFWFYKIIDIGITHTYFKVSYEEKVRGLEILTNLVLKGAQKYSKKDLLVTIREQNPNAFIVEDDERISIDGVSFIYENEKMIQIRY
ncbi:Imm58 family immunity protein [Desulfosediminicola ganghwensis]|uniref:Imm58 family immunity protein n=1 Tax=Desulfosediminicola ganghwensis TaxID=2569540 RepID=UPI0010ABFB2F|nr:hypothetical protein [Desulfosediminicola ganghwensis]